MVQEIRDPDVRAVKEKELRHRSGRIGPLNRPVLRIEPHRRFIIGVYGPDVMPIEDNVNRGVADWNCVEESTIARAQLG